MDKKPNAPPASSGFSAPPPPPSPKAAPGKSPEKHSPRSTVPKVVGLELSSGPNMAAHRAVIFGTGGVGKTTLAAHLPSPIFIDLEDGTRSLNVARDSSVETWDDLRGKLAGLASSPPPGVKTVVIDTATAAEEFAKEHVIANRRTEKGHSVESIEGFGWGKGWQYVYEEFTGLLADLDRLIQKGLNVCLIAHDVSSPVPNPAGEDFIRWEPFLYSGDKKGRGSIRDRVKNWADHVAFVCYDVHVQDGKGRGSGTRSIYTSEMPTHVAKSRTAELSIPFSAEDPGALWRHLGIITPQPAAHKETGANN